MSTNMEDMNQIIEILGKFSVDTLSTEWVNSVFDSDFTEAPDLPCEFEESHRITNFGGLFNSSIHIIRTFVDTLPVIDNAQSSRRTSDIMNTSTFSTTEDEDRQTAMHTKFWIDLSQTVNVKKLMALLFYHVFKGQKYDASESDRDLGIHASSLYFLLLCIPGSNAFRFFHPVFYIKALSILRLCTKLNATASSPSKKSRSSSTRPSQSQQSQRDAMEEDDCEAEFTILTPQETNRLVRALNILINDFMRLSSRFSLKHSKGLLEETIIILAELTKCETHNAQVIFIGRHGPTTLTALSYNAYVSIQGLCNHIHGKIPKTVILIMKSLLHHILMITRGASDMSTRALGVVREHSVIFTRYLVAQLAEQSYEGVYILLQQLCLNVPDKADYRQKTAHSIVEILKSMPVQLYTRVMKWLFKFSHNEKAGHRLFSLEVISKMLCEEERFVGNNETERTQQESISTTIQDNVTNVGSFARLSTDTQIQIPVNRNILSHKFLICIIVSRCRDAAATVRSKALALFAECTVSTNPTVMSAMEFIFQRAEPTCFTTPHINNVEVNCESPIEMEGDNLANIELPNTKMIMSLLERRALDDKMTVRKSALQVLGNIMKLNKEMITTHNLKVLAEHTRDPSLFIRKQIITALTALVENHPSHLATIDCWVVHVLPLVLDPEIKVQEKVIEVCDQVIFRLLKTAATTHEDNDDKLCWVIVKQVIKNSYLKFFGKVIMLWCQSEFKNSHIINVIKTHIATSTDIEAWTLLSCLSQFIVIKDPTFAVNYFEGRKDHAEPICSYTLQQVLKVINNSIKNVPGDRLFPLRQQIKEPVENFAVTADLISLMMDAITLLTYSLEGDDEKGIKTLENFIAPILKDCDTYLKDILFAKPPVQLTDSIEEQLYRHIFTMGECAMLCPNKVNKRMFLMLQSIIFHQESDKCSQTSEIPLSQTQSSQPPTITFVPTNRLQAVSVFTLGKMCLQNEQQAKRIVPALGSMLDNDVSASIKTNIIFVLSDLCVRYATLVDPLMPQITTCLRDNNLEVRRSTLTLLINLLQEDYLKLKGSFFYRILMCLTDEDEDMKSTVEFYVTERLLKRFPKILLQHFIECVFHYNCYEEHESYNKFGQNKQEKEVFLMSGPEKSKERMMLYKFMLNHMPDEQRFTTTHKLCQDVLGGVVDGKIKLTPASLPMLQDTLIILSCDEIKLASLKSKTDEQDQATDQQEQAAMAGMALKKTIISQVVKKNVIENIVPILISLKTKLEEHKSPLMKHLLLYLKELMKDYRNEIKEIFANDKQLAKEIEFDLKRLDEEERETEPEPEPVIEEPQARSPIVVSTPQQSNVSAHNNDATPTRDNTTVDSIIESSISSPKTPRNLINVRQETGARSLMKQALLNSNAASARRKSMSALSSVKVTDAFTGLKELRVSLHDISNNKSKGSPKNTNSNNLVKANTPKESVNNDNNVNNTPQTKQIDILRAISTPQNSQSIVNNITFINNTQNISAIGINESEVQPPHKDDTILLHLKSPDVFAKDEEFSRLRRTVSRRSLEKDFVEDEKREKQSEVAGKRRARGFMEDFSDIISEVDSELSEPSISKQKKKQGSSSTSNKDKQCNSKRTHDMSSVDSKPTKNNKNQKIKKSKDK